MELSAVREKLSTLEREALMPTCAVLTWTEMNVFAFCIKGLEMSAVVNLHYSNKVK